MDLGDNGSKQDVLVGLISDEMSKDEVKSFQETILKGIHVGRHLVHSWLLLDVGEYGTSLKEGNKYPFWQSRVLPDDSIWNKKD